MRRIYSGTHWNKGNFVTQLHISLTINANAGNRHVVGYRIGQPVVDVGYLKYDGRQPVPVFYRQYGNWNIFLPCVTVIVTSLKSALGNDTDQRLQVKSAGTYPCGGHNTY